MGKFIKISSTTQITVNAGVMFINTTNKDSQAVDRLNVRQIWDRLQVDIKQGIHWYPSMIKEWDTVKALAKQDILGLAEEADTCSEPEAEVCYNKLVAEYNRLGLEIPGTKKTVVRRAAPKAETEAISE